MPKYYNRINVLMVYIFLLLFLLYMYMFCFLNKNFDYHKCFSFDIKTAIIYDRSLKYVIYKP